MAENANNPKIAANLALGFPSPYTREDARNWIQRTLSQNPVTHFAIDVEGRAVGGVGFIMGGGTHRRTAVVGYWLGEKYWGQGIATEALKIVCKRIFDEFSIVRIEASIFAFNEASVRVAERAGFQFEGRRTQALTTSSDQTVDELLYVLLR